MTAIYPSPHPTGYPTDWLGPVWTGSDIAGFRKAFYEFGIGEVVTPDDIPFLFARVRSGVPLNFEGVSGGLQFNDFGSVDGSFVIGRVLSNRFVAYKKVLESSQLQ